MPRKQHSKQFKLDAVNYRKEHPALSQVECAKNLGIGVSSLARREAQYKDSDFSSELLNILGEQFNPERPNAVWCTDITYI